jgi:glycosyltransferase involved in cell wall biosynthesis
MWALLRSIDRSKVLYVNSFFERAFSILPTLMFWLKLCESKCMVVAPRGEFSRGALGLKRLRKRLYIGFVRALGMYNGVIWHASSAFEAEDIYRHFPLARRVDVAGVLPGLDSNPRPNASLVFTASDIAIQESSEPRSRSGKRPGRLRIVFVGRCSRMKNLSGALSLLAGVTGDIFFDIYGPAEDAEYWNECRSLIAALPPNIRARYEGEIEHERVAHVFAEHELLLLPTLGENFGHVIGEALAAGCPVLISDRTPWRDLEAEGVGWDLPLSEPERFRSVLQQCADEGHEWFEALSARARSYAAKRAAAPEIIAANRKLFQSALAWPNSPDPV